MSDKAKDDTAREAVYSKDELIAAAETAFGVKPEMVAAAMTIAGKTEASKTKAAEIIEKFRKMEVK